MSEPDPISGLETALLDRANKLAQEYLVNGRQEHERLVAETKQRLHLDEEREALAARAQGERAYQQQVQAAELKLRAELDRLRLDLVNAVLAHLPERVEQVAADEQRYFPLLQVLLRESAYAIECGELVAQFNARDLQRMMQDWDRYAREAAPAKRLTLSPAPIPCTGGVLITSPDGNIRIDNTFEGRRDRLHETLQNVIAEQLAPTHGGSLDA